MAAGLTIPIPPSPYSRNPSHHASQTSLLLTLQTRPEPITPETPARLRDYADHAAANSDYEQLSSPDDSPSESKHPGTRDFRCDDRMLPSPSQYSSLISPISPVPVKTSVFTSSSSSSLVTTTKCKNRWAGFWGSQSGASHAAVKEAVVEVAHPRWETTEEIMLKLKREARRSSGT